MFIECSEQTENSTEEFISPLPDTDLMNRQLPLDLPPHVSRKWMIKVANDIVGCLNQYGIAVVDKFLGDVLGDKILNEVIYFSKAKGCNVPSIKCYHEKSIFWNEH